MKTQNYLNNNIDIEYLNTANKIHIAIRILDKNQELVYKFDKNDDINKKLITILERIEDDTKNI